MGGGSEVGGPCAKGVALGGGEAGGDLEGELDVEVAAGLHFVLKEAAATERK